MHARWCTYARTNVCMHSRSHIHTHMHAHTRTVSVITRARMETPAGTRTYTRGHTRTCTRGHTRTCSRVNTCAHVVIAQTYTHRRTHTHTNNLQRLELFDVIVLYSSGGVNVENFVQLPHETMASDNSLISFGRFSRTLSVIKQDPAANDAS